MTPPAFDGRSLAVPFAADDHGKDVARQLITDLGCEPLDAGGLRQAVTRGYGHRGHPAVVRRL